MYLRVLLCEATILYQSRPFFWTQRKNERTISPSDAGEQWITNTLSLEREAVRTNSTEWSVLYDTVKGLNVSTNHTNSWLLKALACKQYYVSTNFLARKRNEQGSFINQHNAFASTTIRPQPKVHIWKTAKWRLYSMEHATHKLTRSCLKQTHDQSFEI